MSLCGNGVGTCQDCGNAIKPAGSSPIGICASCDREPVPHDPDADEDCLCRSCLDDLEAE